MNRIPRKSLHSRFWSKVDKSGECWIWTGAKNGMGYGQITMNAGPSKIAPLAHRLAYEWLVGAIPAGYDIDHLCRTTACVNPAHLQPVTHRENMRRSKAATKMSCKLGHDWNNPYNVYIRRNGSRWCAECARTRWSTPRRTP